MVYTLYQAQIQSQPVPSNQSNNPMKPATVMLVTSSNCHHFDQSPFFVITIHVANSVIDESSASEVFDPTLSRKQRFHNIKIIKPTNPDFLFVLNRLLSKGPVSKHNPLYDINYIV